MSYTELKRETHKARKQHQCIWCGQMILVGESYVYTTGMYLGDFQTQHFHPECCKAAGEYFDSGEEEFDPCDHKRPTVASTHTIDSLCENDKIEIDLFGLYCRRCKKWDVENDNVECELVHDHLRRRAKAHAAIYFEIYGKDMP